MAFRAITFSFMYVVVNGASDRGATCDATDAACIRGDVEPAGGRAMLQHLAHQSTQSASDEQELEAEQLRKAAFDAVARVAKSHKAVKAARKELLRAEMHALGKKSEHQAEVETRKQHLQKAQEELRNAEQASAQISPLDEEEEESDDDEIILAEESSESLRDVEVKDLIVLAGSADDNQQLTPEGADALGWTPGVQLLFEETTPYGVAHDHAWTFQKGGDCLAVFAATNDVQDTIQVFEDAPMDFCGLKNVHSGVATELIGFMETEQWPAFIEFLNDPSCKRVSAVGHSLGGSVATLFAAAANRGCDVGPGFGHRKNYRMVAFAPFAVSSITLYSGISYRDHTTGRRVRRQFAGTRYSLTEIDGGVDAKFSLPANVDECRGLVLTYFANLSATVGHSSAPTLAGYLTSFTAGDLSVLDGAAWRDVELFATDLFPMMRNLMHGPIPGMEFLFGLTQKLLRRSARKGCVAFSHDPVSTLMSHPGIGTRRGYTHAAVDFQPLVNPLKADPNTVLPLVQGRQASRLPRGDYTQDEIGTMVSGGIPNHETCCYSARPECGEMIVGPYPKACAYSPFR